MNFSPVIPQAWAVLLLIGAPLLAAWLAWRGSSTADRGTRGVLATLRALAFALIAVLFLDPGRFIEPEQTDPRLWAVLVDRSGSMNTPDAGTQTRWDVAQESARQIVTAAGDKARVLTFSEGIETATSTPQSADGPETLLVKSGVSLFQGAAGLGRSLGGLVILSDGRQTRPDAASDLITRAQAAGVPIHVMPIGTDWGGRDLRVQIPRRLLTTFPKKPVTIRAVVENRGLGRIQPRLILRDAAGKELAAQDVALEPEARRTVTFELPELASGEYALNLPIWEGEDVPSNNEDRFRVQVVEGRTRVFLAEGAPYWDSKFLAQLLRNQSFMDIRAVYRLNEERFFRVDTDHSEPAAVDEAVFPETEEALSQLDVVALGKGMEGFLNPARIAALKTFVRDQGGALLLARGKPYSGELPELASLEPVDWGGALDGEYRFEPSPGGVSAGLFEQMLPAPGDAVWMGLPPLKDVERIARLKPFTQVLAMGVRPAAGREERVPLLVARRYGRGVVAMVNADGLWKWDFYPQARELGNMYEDFWSQWLQWAAAYAEFLPGQELSLRLSESTTQLGRPVRATIGWRGGSQEPKPVLRVWKGETKVAEIAASAAEAGEEGQRNWTAFLQPDAAGAYRVEAVNLQAPPDRPGPQAVLNVQAPPTENEALAADPEFLASLAEATGGRVLKPEDAATLGKEIAEGKLESIQAAEPEWKSLWPRGWVLLLLTGLLTGEWWLRRRKGLL